MTEEQLAGYENWAGAWSRAESQAGRVALALVAEVRRLKAEQPAAAPLPPTTDAHREAFREFKAHRNPQPEATRPYLHAYLSVPGECGSVLWELRGESPDPIPDALGILERLVDARRRGDKAGAHSLVPNGCNVTGSWCPTPVPFRGILDGITAADVYGVHV